MNLREDPDAQFGQPEINLGVIPGTGGTQHLTKAVGKSLTMEMNLTSHFLSADKAAQHGLILRIVSKGPVINKAIKVASTIAKKSQIAIQEAKEGVNTYQAFIAGLLVQHAPIKRSESKPASQPEGANQGKAELEMGLSAKDLISMGSACQAQLIAAC
ncbi:hypothetical protein ACQY0O_003885 [Thecaphora frezii]